MGTSKPYGGPAGGLVPSFVDDPAPTTLPRPPAAPVAPPTVPGAPGTPARVPPLPAQSTPARKPDGAGAGQFSGARRGYTSFARSGSRGALGGSLSNYVRTGTGGARRAARRMGSSRTTASGLLGLVRDIQTLGPTETLRRLDLGDLAGQPAAEVFVAIMEFFCPPGGTVDEAISRQAWLEAIGDVGEAAGNFDTLTTEQIREFFLDFVARSIEGRVMADVGRRGVTLPDDVDAVEDVQRELHDFISGATRAQLAGQLDDLAQLSNQQINSLTDQIYELSFELIAAAGEAA